MGRLIAIVLFAVAATFIWMQLPWRRHVSVAAASSVKQPDPRNDYVGDRACIACHADLVNSYHHTTHYRTSTMPSSESILGNFHSGGNILKTSNPELFFRMEQKPLSNADAGFSQVAVAGTPPHTHSRSEQFGVVVGSGEKGQTYLYWSDDQLFQLPVSYWANLGWVNSPGYRDGFADFDRAIIPRCLECHATHFDSMPPPENRYATSGYTVGLECEKCHGPGRQHVEQEKSSAVQISSSAILNPARFTRDQQMDLCAWCHAGHGESLRPSFSYLPGEPLNRYLRFPPTDPGAPLDVHGNQVELLKQSRCYRSSNMTCLTCHDVHASQHDLTEFSKKCLTCHKPDSATFSRPGHPVTTNCIDCHMPKQETNLIVFDWKGKTEKPQIRNHWIKVYPLETGTATQ